jgi:hypothetical protein
MPHSAAVVRKSFRNSGRRGVRASLSAKAGARYSVALPPAIADQVERYAETVDTSASKAIGTLVRLGLESQEIRKRDFFKRLRQNLANDNPKQQDRLVDEFRALILGR